MKTFIIQNNIGKAKYVVSYHDGKKKHADGSEFYDVSIFKNKEDLREFVSGLKERGFDNPLY